MAAYLGTASFVYTEPQSRCICLYLMPGLAYWLAAAPRLKSSLVLKALAVLYFEWHPVYLFHSVIKHLLSIIEFAMYHFL